LARSATIIPAAVTLTFMQNSALFHHPLRILTFTISSTGQHTFTHTLILTLTSIIRIPTLIMARNLASSPSTTFLGIITVFWFRKSPPLSLMKT
jgi:hypothetical protein